MPVLSMFFGIIIRMYSENGEKHHVPHVHAEYQDSEVVIDLDGNIIAGSIDAKKLRMVLVWIDLHHDELVANWSMLKNGEGFYKIDPLK